MPHVHIVGANGVLGSATTRFFLHKGFKVSALIRSREKAIELEKAGAAILQVDITDPVSLKNTFKQVDVVVTAAHGMLGKGKNKSQNVDNEGHKLIINEAKRNGARHFIYTSINSASPDHPIDFFRTKYLIEQYLVSSGLNYTILRLAAFMEWHVYNLLAKNIVEKGKATILGSGTNPTNFIAVKDVVAAIDKIALNENYYDKIISLAGPQNISRNEIAELYGNALNIKPKIRHVPIRLLKVLSVLFQPVHPGIARIMKLSIHTERSDETMDTKESIEKFGLQPTTINDFILSSIEKNKL
ncbi:MAG TPA: SDR family oxidoreductase [Chitinophagaceae bacterium]|nr:SDR family oxidoreductase [Chitinophagaceae bacterium]